MSQVNFRLPFDGHWLTFWGGDTLELNQHHDTPSQEYAFDFIKTDENGKFYRTNGQTNEDYYSFGEDVLAPANGEVLEIVDGLRDNKPGEIHTFNYLGNYVMLKHAEGIFSVLGHFRQNTIAVKVGEKILQGQKIGECGNSGYSTDPHIHFHVQDSSIFAKVDENYAKVNVAKGLKVVFSELFVHVNGATKAQTNYQPVKGNVVSNI